MVLSNVDMNQQRKTVRVVMLRIEKVLPGRFRQSLI